MKHREIEYTKSWKFLSLFIVSARQGPDVIILTQNVFWLVMFPNNYTFLLYLFKVLFLLVKSCAADRPSSFILRLWMNLRNYFYALVKFLFPYLLFTIGCCSRNVWVYSLCLFPRQFNQQYFATEAQTAILPNLTFSNQVKWNLTSCLLLVDSAIVRPSYWPRENQMWEAKTRILSGRNGIECVFWDKTRENI